MINASLNLAGISGIFLLFWSPFVSLATIEQRSRLGPDKFLPILILGRYGVGILVAGILFFQGWRLDPIMQFAVFLLVLGIAIESFRSVSVYGLPILNYKKRLKNEYGMTKVNRKEFPSKRFWLWYLMAFVGVFIPFAGGFLILYLADRSFKQTEKKLQNLKKASS